MQKGVYLYEYMNGSESFWEILLPIKKEFYSNLSMESITDTDYKHTKRVWEGFGFQNLGQHYDLQLQIDTLLLTGIFGSFRNKCLKFFKLESAYFVSASGLAWQPSLKETEVKLKLLIAGDMLLMIEKDIRGGICNVMHRYAKSNNKYMKGCYPSTE